MRKIFAIIFLCIGLFSCTDENDIVFEFKPALDSNTMTMKIGDSKRLNLSVYPKSTNDFSVTWQSTNPNVASVDNEGIVTAVSSGRTDVIATLNNGFSCSCIVLVEYKVDGISLDIDDLTLTIGQTKSLNAVITPKLANNKGVMWSSANEEVVSVDDKGKITALSVGSSVITATSAENSNLFAECTVTVKDKDEYKSLKPDYWWNFENSFTDYWNGITSEICPNGSGINYLDVNSDILPPVGNYALNVSDANYSRINVGKFSFMKDNGCSFSLYMNSPSSPGGEWLVLCQRYGGNGLVLIKTSSILRLQFWDKSGALYRFDSTTSLKTNTWYCVTYVIKPGEYIKLYLDGKLVETKEDGTIPFIAPGDKGMLIGGGYKNNGNPQEGHNSGNSFKGYIDDLRIYKDVILTDEQVMEIFMDKKGNFYTN